MNKKVFYTPEEVLRLFKERNLPSNFCVVPFTNLIFNPGGRISVCRQKGTDHSIGHLEENSLDEIWNNDYIKKWREEFLTGDVKICKNDQSRDACNLWSANYHYFDSATFNITQEKKILKVTANFNGQCNLECKMCHIWQMPNGFYDKNNFMEKAKNDFFPYMKEIEFLSGEPFIQKDTYKLIALVSEVNTDCYWSFTTNAHWKLSPAIIKSLDKIPIKSIIISVDSLKPDIFPQIRKGGSLKKLLQTVDDLIAYEKSRLAQGKTALGLTIHFTAMRDNFLEALDIINFCEEKNLRHSFKTLVEPEPLSVLTLPYEERLDLLDHYIATATDNQLKKTMRVVRPLLEQLTPIDNARIYDLMYQKLRKPVSTSPAHG